MYPFAIWYTLPLRMILSLSLVKLSVLTFQRLLISNYASHLPIIIRVKLSLCFSSTILNEHHQHAGNEHGHAAQDHHVDGMPIEPFVEHQTHRGSRENLRYYHKQIKHAHIYAHLSMRNHTAEDGIWHG